MRIKGKKFAVSKCEGTYIPAAAADRLIASGDGGAALLYLYLLRRGAPDTATAAAALGKSEKDIERWCASLEKLGLLCPEDGAPAQARTPRPAEALPAEEMPQYTAGDIAGKAQQDGGFQAVVEEAQHALGRMLSGNDLRILFGIYDYLGLPPEVILLLINHCVTRTREKQGPGRMPSMRTIEKEAYTWSNREIITLDRAEEYLDELKSRGEKLAVLRRSLGIHDREFTQTERSYAESWFDMGFSVDALAIAYDRTMMRTGKLSWPYMDSIVRSWHEKGLHTPEEIESGDSAKPARAKPGKKAQTQDMHEDVEYLNRIFSELETH